MIGHEPNRIDPRDAVTVTGSSLLIVENDLIAARTVARVLRPRFERIELAYGYRDALDRSRVLPDWTAVLADQHLGDGLGVDVILALRRAQPHLPAALLTGELSPELANLCASERITYVLKPANAAVLDRLFRPIEPSPPVLSPDVEALAREIGASPREAQVLQLTAIQRLSYRGTAAALSISEHTVKSHVRALLGRSGAASIAELRQMLHRRRAAQ